MVDVAQLVRAPDCGSGGRGFEPHLPPRNLSFAIAELFFAKCVFIPPQSPIYPTSL